MERVAVEVGRGPENLGAVVPATAPEDLLGAVGTGALEDGETVAFESLSSEVSEVVGLGCQNFPDPENRKNGDPRLGPPFDPGGVEYTGRAGLLGATKGAGFGLERSQGENPWPGKRVHIPRPHGY